MLLPNTSGCETAEEAVRTAAAARAGGLPDWVKLEVIPDPRYLLPDPVETLRAAAQLVEDGFTVLPYVLPDPVLQKLEEVGCATVMPLAAPIGTGRGLKLRDTIRIMVEQAEVPLVVDAGLGSPSHAAEAMEMGADAVLVNTAIARAGDLVAMARAWLAVEAGRAPSRPGSWRSRPRPSRRARSGERFDRSSSTARTRPCRRATRSRPAGAPRPRGALRARGAERRAGRALALFRGQARGRRSLVVARPVAGG